MVHAIYAANCARIYASGTQALVKTQRELLVTFHLLFTLTLYAVGQKLTSPNLKIFCFVHLLVSTNLT